jgi:hypothetical protein
MTEYKNNHYVPEWYQKRFLPPEPAEKKFYYLDLKPDQAISNGRHFKRNSLLRWGPKRCFCQDDLYTTQLGSWFSTEIEEKFFGPIDATARPALDYFARFTHPSSDNDLFHRLVLYMSIQRLRTPKGLAYLSNLIRHENKNNILIALQRLQGLFCATWSECVWSIADASDAETKFIVSDHPCTVYNKGRFPAPRWSRVDPDPDIWQTGTHTLFPLTLDKILILTNLSWVRYPYGNPLKFRPNPYPFRPAMFNFTAIQTNRKLSNREVIEINQIIKSRAYRYLAAAEESWLYPEATIGTPRWDHFGNSYLLMPDPRSLSFTDEVVFGYRGKKADFFDAYGRKPWQAGYADKTQNSREMETFNAFQGEFARLFGPKRRGLSFEYGALSNETDSEEYHRYHLDLERRNKKHRYKAKRSRK